MGTVIKMFLPTLSLLPSLLAGVTAQCLTTGGEQCNPNHPFAAILHADPCFTAGGKHKCLLAASDFMTYQCDCTVPDCECSTSTLDLSSCTSQMPAATETEMSEDESYCELD